MHPTAYATLAEIEPVGWYYQARARCIHKLIKRYVVPGSARLEILDVGCGTGGTSNSLCQFGHVTGFEPSLIAIGLLKDRYPKLDVIQGPVEDLIRLVRPGSYDLATVSTVLYHRNVSDPTAALRQVYQTLKPGGWLIWNEAAHPILTRTHDAFTEGARRFRPYEMRGRLEDAGFKLRFASHLVGWAFPIAFSLAMAHRARQLVSPAHHFLDHNSDDRILPRLLNSLLREFTYFEWACSLRHLKVPFGVTYLAIAQKSAA